MSCFICWLLIFVLSPLSLAKWPFDPENIAKALVVMIVRNGARNPRVFRFSRSQNDKNNQKSWNNMKHHQKLSKTHQKTSNTSRCLTYFDLKFWQVSKWTWRAAFAPWVLVAAWLWICSWEAQRSRARLGFFFLFCGTSTWKGMGFKMAFSMKIQNYIIWQ